MTFQLLQIPLGRVLNHLCEWVDALTRGQLRSELRAARRWTIRGAVTIYLPRYRPRYESEETQTPRLDRGNYDERFLGKNWLAETVRRIASIQKEVANALDEAANSARDS
jgi:hypothetical protein